MSNFKKVKQFLIDLNGEQSFIGSLLTSGNVILSENEVLKIQASDEYKIWEQMGNVQNPPFVGFKPNIIVPIVALKDNKKSCFDVNEVIKNKEKLEIALEYLKKIVETESTDIDVIKAIAQVALFKCEDVK